MGTNRAAVAPKSAQDKRHGPHIEKTEWSGRVARGDEIEGTMRWYPRRGEVPVAYWFKATAG
jgi:hypothetical protein